MGHASSIVALVFAVILAWPFGIPFTCNWVALLVFVGLVFLYGWLEPRCEIARVITFAANHPLPPDGNRPLASNADS